MPGQLSVSMFNVGFGDCFLVEIPVGRKPLRILFDCGRHSGGTKGNQELANRVIAAARDPDGTARIDVIVGTHRHKDHVSGFAADGWEQVQVREVWMPWSEDPEDPNARGVVRRQLAAAAMALKAWGPTTALGAAEVKTASLMGLALTNEAAMDTLYHGFAGDPVRRYLPDRDRPQEPLTLIGFPGIRFHVMGPTRDESTLGTMEPPRAETFRRLAAAPAEAADEGPLVPFPSAWHSATNPAGDTLTPEEEASIAGLSDSANLTALSAAIDNAINNTSLVIMIEVGEAFLLFCADAQWGNWKSILAQPHWREMLARTTFLKVGHHASHNASPVTLISALLPDGIPAMISVDPDAHSNVPYGKLLDAFTSRKFEVARSDEWTKAPGSYQAGQDVVTLKMDF